MVKSMENGSSVPPFLLKCYEMVDDVETDAMISWSQSDDSFIIWDVSKFSSELLPKYFKHSNFSSFIRQLNIYGFRKTDTDRWEFANERFVKGQKHLLKNIVRRKQSQGLAQKKSSQQEDKDSIASEEDKRLELWKEVECLKTDKNLLMQELIKLQQHQQTSQSKLLILGEQLKGMEKNQQQMLSFIVMAMQSPGYFLQLLQPKENNLLLAETGNNKLSEVVDDFNLVSADGAIVRYQPTTDESSIPLCTSPTSHSEKSMELDLSSDELRDLLMDIDLTMGPFDISLQNDGQSIFPHMPDSESMLDQLLLASSVSDTKVLSLSNEVSTETITEKKSGFEPKDSDVEDQKGGTADDQIEKSDVPASDSSLGNSDNMDILTEQMGILTKF